MQLFSQFIIFLLASSVISKKIPKNDKENVKVKFISFNIVFDKIEKQHLEELKQANFEALSKIAATHSDGIIMASENLPDSVIKNIKDSKKPHLDFSQSKDEETYIEFYNKF